MSEPPGWDSDTVTWSSAVHSQTHEPEVEVFTYAGWVRRFAGLVFDQIVFYLALAGVFLSLGVVALAVVLAVDPDLWRDRDTRLTVDAVTGADLILNLILITVALAITVGVWWFYFPAAMSTKGGTLGMRLLGTSIASIEGHHNVRLGQAVARFFFSWLLGAIAAIPVRLMLLNARISDWWEWASDASQDKVFDTYPPMAGIPTLSSSSASLLIGAALFSMIPTAVYFFTPRRQTLYDMVAGTVIIKR